MNIFIFRLAQNLVFYGVSQNTGESFFSSCSTVYYSILGAWQFDPYLSFALSAFVELLAYVFIHIILNRLGRKIPYCTFAIVFGLLALLVLPIQTFLSADKSSLLKIIF